MTTIHTIEMARTAPTRKQDDNRFVLALVLAVLVLVGVAIAFAPAKPETIDSDPWIVGP